MPLSACASPRGRVSIASGRSTSGDKSLGETRLSLLDARLTLLSPPHRRELSRATKKADSIAREVAFVATVGSLAASRRWWPVAPEHWCPRRRAVTAANGEAFKQRDAHKA